MAILGLLLMDVQILPLLLNCEIPGEFLELPEPWAADCDMEVTMTFTSWVVGGLVKVPNYIGVPGIAVFAVWTFLL